MTFAVGCHILYGHCMYILSYTVYSFCISFDDSFLVYFCLFLNVLFKVHVPKDKGAQVNGCLESLLFPDPQYRSKDQYRFMPPVTLKRGTPLICCMLCTKTTQMWSLLSFPPHPAWHPCLSALLWLSPAPLSFPLVLLSIHDAFISGFWNKKMHPLVCQVDQKPSSTQVVLGHPFPTLCVYLAFLLNFRSQPWCAY